MPRFARNARPSAPTPPKQPFDIDQAVLRLRQAIQPFRPAAMFELADEGYRSVFQQLIACIISIRTRDETTTPTARRLFAVASTPQAVARLSVDEIDRLIAASTFHDAKARQIHEIAQATLSHHAGTLPCDPAVLLSFRGVGPKCANLVLGVACGLPFISVDIHVHRVTNRWGYIAAPTPEKTMAQLEKKLPRSYWIEINRLLVPFGKHICTHPLPRCSTCPLLSMCQQVGVTAHR